MDRERETDRKGGRQIDMIWRESIVFMVDIIITCKRIIATLNDVVSVLLVFKGIL